MIIWLNLIKGYQRSIFIKEMFDIIIFSYFKGLIYPWFTNINYFTIDVILGM